MKRSAPIAVATLTTALLVATPCYAHALDPFFLRFGPLAPIVAIVSIVGCLPLVAIVAFQALILNRAIPGGEYLGDLWRAAVVFLFSKTAEILPICIDPDVLMGLSSEGVFQLIRVLVIIVGLVVIALSIELLYWRRRPRLLQLIWLVITLECTSLGGLYLTVNTLIWAEIVR